MDPKLELKLHTKTAWGELADKARLVPRQCNVKTSPRNFLYD
jgi:hypothetical protein